MHPRKKALSRMRQPPLQDQAGRSAANSFRACAWAGEPYLPPVAAAELIGGRALVVNAIDNDAAGLWTRHGFLCSKDDPYLLFRSIGDIAASLRMAQP